MREVKFRVWDGKLGQFIALCEKNLLSNNVVGSELSSVILMQYTGLKDKNGKEIYEGDIVGRDDYVGALVVTHSNFDYDSVSGFFLFGVNGENEFSSFDGVEVIGNIYENPELIYK